jgi:hypothetical protein
VSSRDELNQSLDAEIEGYDKYLKDTRKRIDLAQHVLERKKEAEAKRVFVRFVPDELLDEVGDRLLVIQQNESKRSIALLAGLGEVSSEAQWYLGSGTASSSAYLGMAETVKVYEASEIKPEWTGPVIAAYSELADEKAKKVSLPKRLNKIGENLGDSFNIAQQSVEKARAELIGIDQAAIQLRDVLQQLWGCLANWVRDNCPQYKDSKLELRREKHRGFAIECLANDDASKVQLTYLLENMASIHEEISETQFGKNPLTNNSARLIGLYRRWILVVDDVVNYMYRRLQISD